MNLKQAALQAGATLDLESARLMNALDGKLPDELKAWSDAMRAHLLATDAIRSDLNKLLTQGKAQSKDAKALFKKLATLKEPGPPPRPMPST